MRTHGKKYKAAAEKRNPETRYQPRQAIDLVKSSAFAKFDETVEVAVRLGVDPKHADQAVRGTVVLPAGTGKAVRVLVIAAGDKAREAEAAGADYVGTEYIAKIKENWMDFDVLIATPDQMGQLGALGRILGPRGLMPNPKVGTVTPDVATAVKNAKAGQVQYRTDKAGIVHATIGRKSFSDEDLKKNLVALIEALNKAKPATSKGIYLRKVSLSSTMGAGVRIDQGTLTA
jgi:large subunit ribosomal protein L1